MISKKQYLAVGDAVLSGSEKDGERSHEMREQYDGGSESALSIFHESDQTLPR